MSETAPPGLLVSANNSVNSENASALAAILVVVLSPGGSSDSGRAARLAALARSAGYVVRRKFRVFAANDQTKHLSMVVDSGLVSLAQKLFMQNMTKLLVPLQLQKQHLKRPVFAMEVCNNLATDELTITEYSLTTST